VVLNAYSFKATNKAIKPTVSVYTADGKKLNKKLYSVDYGTDNVTVGAKTLTVTLAAGSTYKFSDGTDTFVANYNIVDKSAGAILTVSKTKSVYYGPALSVNDLKPVLKVGGKKVTTGWTIDWNYEDLANGEALDAGVYTVTVTATNGDTTVYAQTLLTVKPAKLTLKTLKLTETISLAEVAEYTNDDYASLIEAYIADNELLPEDSGYYVDANSIKLPKNMSKAGKKSITFTVSLDSNNYAFGSKTSKTAKASLTVNG
jgi:hypothetical protein